MRKREKGDKPGLYWKKYNAHVQRGLRALGILEVLPDLEYPKPNKVVREFLTDLENRFDEPDLEIRKQVVMPILSVIRGGFVAAVDDRGKVDKNEEARWFMLIVAKLGIKMSLGNALLVLDGFDAMDEFLLRQSERKFEDFFTPEKKKKKRESSDDLGDLDDIEDNDLVPVGEGTEEEETPE